MVTAMGSSLFIAYYPEQQTERLPGDGHVLAVLRFSQMANTVEASAGELGLSLEEMGGNHSIEVWHSTTPVTAFHKHGFSCRSNGEFLFAAMTLEEQRDMSIEWVSRRAYAQIFTLLDQLGGYHLLRVWNYFPRINQRTQALDRYQSFCIGRHQAFKSRGVTPESTPAATAIGTKGEGLIVYFLASRQVGMPIENPRQVSAYRYPGIYSPKPPMFSRAVQYGDDREGHLFVSGTASVIGHESHYMGDVQGQLGEALNNLEAILDNARHEQVRSLRDLSQLKVYLRHAADFPLIRGHLTNRVGEVPCMFLLGDICRSELLVEIDALYCSTPS